MTILLTAYLNRSRNVLFQDDPWLTLVGGLIILTVIYIDLFLHEFGHWLFAKLFGMRILGFSVGQGRVLFKREKPDSSQFVQFRLWPIGGYVIPVNWDRTESRAADFLISAGGPLFTALSCGTMAFLAFSHDFSYMGQPWALVMKQAASILFVLSAMDFAYNVIPHRFRMGSDLIANDGQAMLRALFGHGYPRADFHRQALQRAALPTGLPTDSEPAVAIEVSPEGKDYHWKFLFHSYLDQFEEAGAILEEALQCPSLTKAERLHALTSMASLALDARRKEFVDRATKTTEEALTIVPESEFLLVKLAILKVVNRFYKDGRRLLEDLLDESKSPHIKACAQCGLAIADARQNDLPAGKNRLALAHQTFPSAYFYDLAYSAVMVAPHLQSHGK